MSGGLDLSRLSPSDAVAALRSYPRRYKAQLTSLDEDERADDFVHRAGPDCQSAVDHADHAARSIAILGEALRQVLVHDNPTLLPAVADDSAREWQMAAQPSAVVVPSSPVSRRRLAASERHLRSPPASPAPRRTTRR